VLFTSLFIGCSYEKKTWTSKTYHNLTAHYNGYFYAEEEIRKIEESILKANQDNYDRILRLFPTFDSSLAKSYEKEVEEAIKMASISIQRHPNSKWVDDAYILVGKARLYSLDWGNAIETFKYVNGKSDDPEARHRAIIDLIRTFTEHKEFNNAQAAIDFLFKEKLNKKNLKAFYLEKAYFHQMQEDYDNMVRSLTAVSPLLKKRDRSGRIYFIIGQVYQKLGFESEAFNFYRKCLATNPEYETDFYARLYMAQVAEISRSRDINTARKSFRRLLKDNKNRDFKDRIYYELGAFELKQNNMPQAITNFNLAIREGTDKRVDGIAYLRLGEIYYDTLKDYELSQAYYDSAIGALPSDFENYAAVKERQEVLNEFVRNLKTIEWQDSLLAMASMDSAAIRGRIDSVFAARKKSEEAAQGKKKRRKANRIQIEPTEVNIFSSGGDGSGTADWYFGNPSAMALGESEFKRIWGSIQLEDNWRRSSRLTSTPGSAPNVIASNEDQINPEQASSNEPIDPAEAEFLRVDKQIPRTDEQRTEALKKIEDAYFNLGDIYYFKLEEKDNAESTYEKLLERFPESDYAPEVLYKIYLITKEYDPERAGKYAELLMTNYPFSTFAKILANPEYLQESSQTAEKQKDLYKKAYASFEAGNYIDANLLVEQGLSLGQTVFSSNLQLLKVLILGGMEDIETYQNALNEFMRVNPDSDLIPYAKKLLDASTKFKEQHQAGMQVMRYRYDPEVPHYFLLVYKKDEPIHEIASSVLENFNKNTFDESRLNTSNMALNETYGITIVSDFSNEAAAELYYKAFTEKLETLGELRNHKFNKFVISTDNFNIFYRTKGLNEYLQFFEKNYRPETP
jgi:tetratricopeptide (TPR) repeat protein